MVAGQLWLFDLPKPLVERLGEDFFRALPSGSGVYLMCGASEGFCMSAMRGLCRLPTSLFDRPVLECE
jgi:hypothetical protein